MRNFKKAYEKYTYYCELMRNTPSNIYVQFDNTMNIILLSINIILFIPLLMYLFNNVQSSMTSQIVPFFNLFFIAWTAYSLFKSSHRKHLKFFFYNSQTAIEKIKKNFYKNKKVVREIFNEMMKAQIDSQFIRNFIEEVEQENLTDESIDIAYKLLYPKFEVDNKPVSLYDSLMSEHKGEDKNQENFQFFNANSGK